MKNKARNLRKLQSLLTAVFIVGMIFTATSCKDDEGELEEIVASDPEITNIMESSGYIGDEVTINGLNFNDGASETVVKFGTVSADVTGGTTTTIETSVPDGVSFGSVDVTVTVSDLVSESESFTVLDPADTLPAIVFTDFNPTTAKHDSLVVITGENFTEDVEVYINDVLQENMTYVSDTELKVYVTIGSGSGAIELIRGSQTAQKTGSSFTYKYSYRTEEFSNYSGQGIAMVGDGTFYISYDDGLHLVNSDDEIIETIDSDGFIPTPGGLFLAENDTLYIVDQRGRIFQMKNGSTVLDTLIGLDDENMQSFGLYHITGDNKGYLYATGLNSKNVFKINISTKTIEVLAVTEHTTTGIAYYNDSLHVNSYYELFKISINGVDQTPVYIIEEDAGYYFGASDIYRHQSGNYILVSNANEGGIYSLSEDGIFIEELDWGGRAISEDIDGNLIVATTTNTIKLYIE